MFWSLDEARKEGRMRMMGRDNDVPAIFPFTIVLVFIRFSILSEAVDTGLIVPKTTVK